MNVKNYSKKIRLFEAPNTLPSYNSPHWKIFRKLSYESIYFTETNKEYDNFVEGLIKYINDASTGYMLVNGILRRRESGTFPKKLPQWAKTMFKIFKSDNMPVLSQNCIVYRGVSSDMEKILRNILKQNGIFEEKSFLSTSKTILPGFGTESCCILEMHMKSGTKCMYVKEYAKKTFGKETEKEIIFTPDLKFKITNIRTTAGNMKSPLKMKRTLFVLHQI
jgi:transposase-like protein